MFARGIKRIGQELRCVLPLLFVLPGLCAAEETASAEKAFAVQHIWFQKKDDGYTVNADLQLGHEQLLNKILRGGYQVRLFFELEFLKRNLWLLDSRVGDIGWTGELSYDALRKRYFLVSGERRVSYISLAEAIEDINQLRAGKNSDSGFIKLLTREDIYLRARFYAETKNLPAAMQIGLLIDNAGMSSGWVKLPLTRDE